MWSDTLAPAALEAAEASAIAMTQGGRAEEKENGSAGRVEEQEVRKLFSM